jgi:serine/threonine-protein kinase
MSNFEEQLKSALAPAYEIERELTGGGMSRVFVAVDRSLGRRVVIKVLPPELTAGVNRERFRREIQVAAQLQHPHIVTLLSAGEEGELLYYTMPYIEGESLRHELEKGRFAVKDVVRILHDVVDALAYAHARGVIHRDIKPGNILRQGAHALVTDFGVAKALNAAMPVSGITTAGMAIGTPAYMAPEQLAGDPSADHRLDIYAVGLLAYELLSGESPFTGPSPAATMAAQLTRLPEPLYQLRPDVPAPLSAIIMQCLAKEPDERPPTAEALMTALDAITSSSGEVKTAATKTLPAVASRRRRMTVGAGLATIALASAVMLYASGRRGEPIAPAAATASSAGAPAAASPAPPPPAAAKKDSRPAPLQLSAADSLAIAEAVQKRLAREEAIHGREQVIMFADSIAAVARKVAIDSIIRASIPRGMNVPVFTSVGPLPPEWMGKRRVVVVEPRKSNNDRLNDFGATLTEGIRSALLKKKNYSVVDPDSVALVLSQTRVRSEVEKALRPNILISPTFAGRGDTMTVIVTVRDSRAGTRVASARFDVSNPDAVMPSLLQTLVEQIESLRTMPPTAPRANPNFQFREFRRDSSKN